MGAIGKAIARGIIERDDYAQAIKDAREFERKEREIKGLRDENERLKKELEECRK